MEGTGQGANPNRYHVSNVDRIAREAGEQTGLHRGRWPKF